LAVTDNGKPVGAPSSAALPPGFRSRLLEGLTPPEIKAVLAAGRQREISPNEVLVREGHPVTHLFLLVTGFAASYKATLDGRKLFLRWISPGDAFGLAALLQTKPPPYFTTVQAAVRGDSVFVWERVSAHALLSQVARLRENAYAIASEYVITLADALAARASQTAQQRLARVLVESARHIGRARPEGIELGLTNEQLAHMADVSLFTVSRQLSGWHSERILAKSRGKILLRAPKRLGSHHF
jgi:CRP/FNR family transcriptional regulator, nitrogen oxide reductase regulator